MKMPKENIDTSMFAPCEALLPQKAMCRVLKQ